MTRRELLRSGALLLAGPSSAAGTQEGRAASAPVSGDGPVAVADGAPLSESERETLLAFCEVLVGDRALAPDEREEVLEYIENRGRASADTLRLYRRTAALLDGLARGPFAGQPMADRMAIVARNGLAPSRAPLPSPDAPAHGARTYVAPELIRGYYAASMGWAAVDYRVFPGRCSDLVRYTRPEP
jgi:hypothetical protein